MKNIKKHLFLALISLLIISCSNEDVTETSDLDTISSTEENIISDEILQLINLHRENIGLSTLENNDTAKQLAKEHTNYMISVDGINHDNSNTRFQSLREQEDAKNIGENVARFQTNAASAVDSWLNSDSHRKNIEGDFTHSGVATVKDDEGKFYFTQIFFEK